MRNGAFFAGYGAGSERVEAGDLVRSGSAANVDARGFGARSLQRVLLEPHCLGLGATIEVSDLMLWTYEFWPTEVGHSSRKTVGRARKAARFCHRPLVALEQGDECIPALGGQHEMGAVCQDILGGSRGMRQHERAHVPGPASSSVGSRTIGHRRIRRFSTNGRESSVCQPSITCGLSCADKRVISGTREDRAVRRSDLLKSIGRAARESGLEWKLDRQGANHEIWRLGDLLVPVPRHREVGAMTARRILMALEPALGKDWWRR